MVNKILEIMRRVLLLLILISVLSCVKDTKQSGSGYNCINGNCIATFDKPTYLTLQDCQSDCKAGVTPPPPASGLGRVSIHCSYVTFCGAIIYWGTVSIGVGNTYADVTLDNYIDSKKFTTNSIPSDNETLKVDLKPSTYYYKAKLTSECSTLRSVEKIDSFTITSGKITVIGLSLQ